MKSPLLKVLLPLPLLANTPFAADPLPSWNDGSAKRTVISFVERVAKEGSPAYVPSTERIATFDTRISRRVQSDIKDHLDSSSGGLI